MNPMSDSENGPTIGRMHKNNSLITH